LILLLLLLAAFGVALSALGPLSLRALAVTTRVARRVDAHVSSVGVRARFHHIWCLDARRSENAKAVRTGAHVGARSLLERVVRRPLEPF